MSGSRTSFEEWKRKKIERGEWLSPEEFRRKKDLERRDYLLRELEEVNRRLNPKPHEELRKDFVTFCKSITKEEAAQKGEKRKIDDEYTEPSKKPKGLTREMILDTETTGLTNSDRIVEISLLEMIDGVKTGRRFHQFLNPEINITKKAISIHNITNEKIENCPKFKEIAEKLISFIGDSVIIAHNSKFDMRMLNNELERSGWEKYSPTRFIDTLEIARYLYPSQKNTQDALCERFKIDNTTRTETGIHSAIEDTAHLYLIYQNLVSILKEKNLTPYDFKSNSTD